MLAAHALCTHAQTTAAAPSNSMEMFETWTAEEVSEWLVENGLPEDVARTFEVQYSIILILCQFVSYNIRTGFVQKATSKPYITLVFFIKYR